MATKPAGAPLESAEFASAPPVPAATGGPPCQDPDPRALLARLRVLEEKARGIREMEAHLRELSQELDLLTRVSDAARVFHAAADLRELLEAGVAECVKSLEAEKGSLLLHERQTGELVVAGAYGACSGAIRGQRLPVGQGVAGHVALRREPLRVEDITRDGRFAPRQSARYATGSFLCVPVQAEGSLLGVLSVTDRGDGRPFSEQHLRVAVSLADELAIALRRVEQVDAWRRVQQELISKLAHELRNPLDGALRFINLTLADHSPEDCRQRYLLASRQGLERLSGIVDSLVGLSQGGRGSDAPAQVNDLMRQALALLEGKAHERGVRVELDLADGMPAVPGGTGLFQVFTNLVSNALDAMAIGGGTLSVTSRQVDGAVVVRVADTGCGMPPQVLERLFTPFFTTKPPGKGMGLGLAVCREVVDRLRGRIEVVSKPGRGTVFTVAVPCGTIHSGAARL